MHLIALYNCLETYSLHSSSMYSAFLTFKELDVIEKEFKSAVGAIIEYWQVKRIPEPILKSLKSMAKVIEQLGTV